MHRLLVAHGALALTQLMGGLFASAQPSLLDTNFFAGTGPDGTVYCMAQQNDGGILIGGAFTAVDGMTSRRLSRLNPNGSLDAHFQPNPNGEVRAMTLQPDGRILVGGSFTTIAGTNRIGVAQINPDASIDATFDPGAAVAGTVRSVGLQRDGMILVGGLGVVRLFPDGTRDASFQPPSELNFWDVNAVVAQPDGKILVATTAATGSGMGSSIVRLNPDGSLDTSFSYYPVRSGDLGSRGPVLTVATLDDGIVLTGGIFDELNGVARSSVGRLFPDGSVDTNFVTAVEPWGIVRSLAATPDGKVVLGGDFTRVNGVVVGRLARLNADGTMDESFAAGAGADGTVYSVASTAEGALLVAGAFTTIGGVSRPGIARLNGSAPGPPFIAVHPASQTIAAGDTALLCVSSSWVPGTTFRWQFNGGALPDGMKPWLTFPHTSSANAGPYRVVISNSFGVVTSAVATLSVVDGSLWPGSLANNFFPPGGANSNVLAIAIQRGGKMLVAGQFTSFNQSYAACLTRLNGDGTIDTSFGATQGVTAVFPPVATVNALAVQRDGKVVLGGFFERVNGTPLNSIGRLNADGSVDSSFDVGSGIEGLGLAGFGVNALAIDSLGRVLVAGTFSSVDGVARPGGVARLRTNGSVDTEFGLPRGSGHLNTVAVDQFNRVLIGGTVTGWGGARTYLARLLDNGKLDLTFNPVSGPNGVVNAVLVQPDGRILIGGAFTTVNGVARAALARLNSDGSLDFTFDPGAGLVGTVYALARQGDGRILVGGLFTSVNGVARRQLARLQADGAVDMGFESSTGLGINFTVRSIAFAAYDDVLIGGSFTGIDGHPRYRVALLHGGPLEQPRILTSPSNQIVGAGESILLSPVITGLPTPDYQWFFGDARIPGATNGSLVIDNARVRDSGTYTLVARNPFGATTSAVARVTVNASPLVAGRPDTSLATRSGPNDSIYSVRLQPDGRVLIGGSFTSVDGIPRRGIARLLADGSLDPGFDPGATVSGTDPGEVLTVQSIVIQSDGKIIIGGRSISASGSLRSYLARLDQNGRLDPDYNPDVIGNSISTLLLQEDGRLVIGGWFGAVDGLAQSHLARLNCDGTLDTNFLSGSGPNGPVLNVARQDENRLIIAGNFSKYDNFPLAWLARVSIDGQLDHTFYAGSGPGPEEINDACFPVSEGSRDGRSFVLTSATQPDGKTLVGGLFNSFSGIPRSGIVRLRTSGEVDTDFIANTDHSVWAICVEPAGRILVGGCFTSVNGTLRNRLARLNPDGSLDREFNLGSGVSGANPSIVRTITLQPDGRALAGGDFTSVNGLTRYNLVRLQGDVYSFNLAQQPEGFTFSIGSVEGHNYFLEYSDSLERSDWDTLPVVPGDGGVIRLSDPAPSNHDRLYRVRAE